MLILAASILIATPPAPDTSFRSGRTATVFSTIGHSEWCPAGNVTLNLVTGRYALTPTAPRRLCSQPDLERRVFTGRLDEAPLIAIRRAYRRAKEEGLDACLEGTPVAPIISNGGTPTLVLTTGSRTIVTPSEHSCQSNAARALHDAVDEAFESFRQR